MTDKLRTPMMQATQAEPQKEKPTIVGYDAGFHNKDMEASIQKMVEQGHYKDQSTVIIIPALNSVATKAASSWWNIMFPPNQKVVKLFAQNMEVGEAYSQTIDMVLSHPELKNYKYILTLEADNVVPPDVLTKLLATMEAHPEYACIGALYWCKGEGKAPQLWGDPTDPVLNFRPQIPRLGEVQEVCGTGMGANLWRMDMFRDERLRKPWFKTQGGTQDLYFWHDARKYYRCAVDTNILVGHVDKDGFVW